MMNKEDIIKAFQDELELLHTKLDELKVQTKLGKEEVAQLINPEIEKIESQLSLAKKRFEELAGVSGEALNDLKDVLTMALHAISESVKSSAKLFK